MQQIRYECALVEQALVKEYASTMEAYLKRIQGLNDMKPLVLAFEKDFASYIGVKHAVAVNSGSDALQMILRVLGIKEGDEVIIPDLTYQAVALAVIYSGARPVVVDVNADDLTINVEETSRAVTKKTKAIIAAHMFGRPCKLEQLRVLCDRRGIKLIEDVCQAESSRLDGKMLGSFGDLAAFSFSYYKPLSTCGGGGGMVVFNDPAYSRIAGWMQDWRDDPELFTIGQRFAPLYFMDLVALRVKLPHLSKIINSRKKIKALYEQGLGKVKGLEIFVDRERADSVPQNFVVCTEKRDELIKYFLEEGVLVQKPYRPLHVMAAYHQFADQEYPVSDAYFRKALHLPLYSFMAEDKAAYVIEHCRKFFAKKKAVQ